MLAKGNQGSNLRRGPAAHWGCAIWADTYPQVRSSPTMNIIIIALRQCSVDAVQIEVGFLS